MTIARRIARHRPPRAGHARVAALHRARMRALAVAALGAVTGLAFGAAILIAAPGVGGASTTDGARFDRPAGSSPGWTAVSVASVIAPAQDTEFSSRRDREEGAP